MAAMPRQLLNDGFQLCGLSGSVQEHHVAGQSGGSLNPMPREDDRMHVRSCRGRGTQRPWMKKLLERYAVPVPE